MHADPSTPPPRGYAQGEREPASAQVSEPPARYPASAPADDVQLFAPEGSAEGCASGECLPEPPAAPEPPKLVAAPRALTAKDDVTRPLAERWKEAVDAVRSASPRHGASLAHGKLLWIRPGEVAVAFAPAAGFHKATVTAQIAKQSIERIFAGHFGRPTALKVETADAAAEVQGPTIAEQEQKARATFERETEAELRAHPAVRSALKILGGEIEHIQVHEPAPKPAGEPSAEG